MQIRFEWDERKARINRQKHGVSFEEASTVFLDPLLATTADVAHSEYEERYLSFGLSTLGRILAVVHTQREDADFVVVRVVSCRRATRAEIEKYEEV